MDDDGRHGALDGIRTVFIAMGSVGTESVLQRIAISAAAGISSVEQVTRLSCSTPRRTPSGSASEPHYSIDLVHSPLHS